MAASSKSTGYMESRDILHDRLEYMGVTDAVTMVGFEDCVIGVLERFGTDPIVIYDKDKVIQQLIAEGCEDYDGALEYYEYNQLGASYGGKAPGFFVKLAE